MERPHLYQQYGSFAVFDGHNGQMSADSLHAGLHVAVGKQPAFHQAPDKVRTVKGGAFGRLFDGACFVGLGVSSKRGKHPRGGPKTSSTVRNGVYKASPTRSSRMARVRPLTHSALVVAAPFALLPMSLICFSQALVQAFNSFDKDLCVRQVQVSGAKQPSTFLNATK